MYNLRKKLHLIKNVNDAKSLRNTITTRFIMHKTDNKHSAENRKKKLSLNPGRKIEYFPQRNSDDILFYLYFRISIQPP